MAAFQYLAIDDNGKQQKGIVEGDSARQVRQQLRDRNLMPLEVKPVSATKASGPKKAGQIRVGKRQRLPVKELSLITRQLATLLSAGMPLEETLMAVAEQTEKPKIKAMILAVRSRVLEGHTLATGMAEFPQAFTDLYRATVAAGEKSGHLDIVLNRLADYTEQQNHMRQKIQQALIYPAIMGFVSIMIVIFLLIYVVPKIVGVFTATKQALPVLTVILIEISSFIQTYGILMLLIFIGFIFAFRYMLRKNEHFRARYHGFLLGVPIIGNAIKTLNTARYARTFGILFSAGVSVIDAMRVATELILNLPMSKSIAAATEQVREGVPINRALRQSGYFPPMSIHLIASGEGSGQLENMLERAADNQDREVESLIESTLTLFEPIMILVMGSVVLFIVLAVLLPIFALDQYSG